MADVKFIMEVEDAGFIRKVTEAEQALSNLQKTTGKTGQEVRSFGSDFLTRLVPAFTVASLAADGVRKGFGFVKDTLVDSIKQAADYEKAVKGLDTAFSLSGRTMPGMVNNLKEYASQMESLGLAEDDEILRAESLFLQFTHLNEDGIEAATRGAIGLASVFDMDLKSASEAVKNGVEGNYRAIAMLIPAVREATTEEGKRAEMMKGFESLYQRAIADTGTYSGQVKQLGIEWKNAKQELGEAVLSTGFLQETMNGFSSALNDITGKSIRDYQDRIKTTIEANNAAGVSLNKMAEALGWNGSEVARLRMQYNLNSVVLKSWVQDGLLGTKAAATLTTVLEAEAAAQREANKAFSDTGTIDDLNLHIDAYRTKVKAATIDIGEFVEVDVADWATRQTANFDPLNDVLESLMSSMQTIQQTAGDFRYKTPAGETVWYKEWLEKQRAFAKESTGLMGDTFDKWDDYAQMFYMDLNQGFFRAFEAFSFTTEGFKNFFVGTWEAIADAFHNILAKMLADWLALSFVKFLGNIIFPGESFFSPATPGSIGMQHGFEGTVVGPKLFYVEPGVREHVSATPVPPGRSSAGGGSMTLNFGPFYCVDGGEMENTVRHKIIPIIKDAINHGDLQL